MGVSPESPIPLPRVSAADLAPVGLVALGGDGRILYANARARELLGEADGEGLVGADARSFHAVPDVALSTAHDHLEGDRLRDLELTLRRRAGGSVTVRIQGRLASDGPAGVAAVVTLEDVGDRRAAQERALQTRTMSAVGRLAGGMAHHFNNLLASIRANLSLVESGLAEGQPVQEELDGIDVSARRASEIADLLLLVSGREVLARGELELGGWVYQAAGVLRHEVADDIELVARAGRGALPIRMDADRLLQAVRHLVANAEEALAGGGQIRLDVREVELRGEPGEPAFAPPALPGRYACLEVGDDGLGMNQETLARVLEPFFSTKRDREGAGLGLALVYGIVAQARGHVSVESAPVLGTRVRVLFPLADADAGEGAGPETPLLAEGWEAAAAAPVTETDAPPAPARPSPGMSGASAAGTTDREGAAAGGAPGAHPREHRAAASPPDAPTVPGGPAPPTESELVVVVDDEDSVRLVMEKILKRAGFAVRTAVHGRAAQRILQEEGERVVLVVSDVMMPELNGVELARWSLARRPGLPVLLVSGFVDSPLIQAWLEDQPESFVSKPFEPEDFLERVLAHLPARHR